ncbi:uncharacterized protein [Fopius arisanus]|uniref:Uncharacterized protein n=1 Tax=Fopius arisanus TaxID=64838 RepID=A0A9R1TCM6_9HYME|nr:PREDICTED: uncharacterized protein LOC105268644 [Fopius arisanus]
MEQEPITEPDLEQECEDVVFELCDTRERYPQKCAEELSKSLRLRTQINSAPVILKSSGALSPSKITDEQLEFFGTLVATNHVDNQELFKIHLDNLLRTAKDLKTVVEQVRGSADCTIENILKKT